MKLPLLLCLLALGSCPGSAKYPRTDGKSPGSEPSFTPLPDGAALPDKPVASGDQRAGEKPAADLNLNSTVGGPCPCAQPLLCVLKACRQPCNQVICNGPTNCSAGESCVNTQANTPVCVPGVATGQACSATEFCAAGNVCLGTDPKATTGKCYATCPTAGQSCGKSTCSGVKDTLCFFCP